MNDKKRLGNGTYSILVTILIAAALVFLNLIAGKISTDYSEFDFSTSKLYTLTDVSKEYLTNLEQDVTLYYICEQGQEDDTIEKLLKRYSDASSHVHIEQIDPVLYPGFTSKYEEESVENNSVIVTANEKCKTLRPDNFYISSYSPQKNGYVNSAFDGEGQITSAIAYVLSDSRPKFYIISGNGESELGQTFKDIITKNNIELEELNLLTCDEIPEDAASIILLPPANDYTEKETEVLLAYLENGGKAVILSNYSPDEFPYFRSVLENYGLTTREGIILEGDSNHYISYQYCVVPDVQYTDITIGIYGKNYTLLPMCQGIKILDSHRDSISYQPLLITSMSSYNKEDIQNMTTAEKEEGDQTGPFPVGMLIQEDIDRDHKYDTEIIYFSSGYLVDEDYNLAVAGGNAELLSGAVSYLSREVRDSQISVPSKTLEVPYLTITSFNANMLTVISVFGLPLLFLICGLVKWIKRRKK